MRLDNVVRIYTACRHIDKSNVICHGTDAISRSMRFNYAPHLTRDMQSSVQHFIKRGFNVTMIWEKFIYDVKDRSGELYRGIPRNTCMTRKGISNIYNDTIRLEYVKDESDPKRVECRYKEQRESFFFYQKQNIVENIPFTIGIQTKWMCSMMLKYSHNNIISMDPTFSTNKYGVSTYLS